jgi:hypothetical protein
MKASVDVIATDRTSSKFLSAVVIGMLMMGPTVGQAQDSLVLAPYGAVGIGIESPARQLHLRGSNATFRMDRNADTAAFLLVRTDNDYNPLKTFSVGTNAAGTNNGEFIINDLGANVGGGGSRRMTIMNNGDVQFTGTVSAPAFVNTSSARYKENVETLAEASGSVGKLRGVRFTWKETGEPSLGLIAEEVAEVLPELVKTDADSGEVEAVNYAALTAVLVEALKEQGARLDAMETELARYRAAATTQETQIGRLRTRVKQLETAGTRLTSAGDEGVSSASVAALQTP